MSRATPRSLRIRLAVLAGLAALLVIGGAGALYTRHQAQEAFRDELERVAGLLGALSVPVAMALATNELERLDGYAVEVARAGGEHVGVLAVAVLDYEGRVIARSDAGSIKATDGGGDIAAATDAFLTEAARDERPLWRRRVSGGRPILEVSMPAVSGLRWGTLVATIDLSHHESRVAMQRNISIALAVGFTLVMIAVLYVGLSRIVVRPVRRMADAAAAIAAGDLSARVNLGTDDELGTLAGTFDHMAAELQAYTQDLERKVEERASEIRRYSRELERVNEQLTAANEELEKLATTDSLTGLYNRRYLMRVLDFELRRSKRFSHPLTVVMIDVDHFKTFNDTFGHLAGDAVLKQVATTLRDALRSTDILARYGGEEFAVILLDTPRQTAATAAEKLRNAIEHAPVHQRQITVSLGVASSPEDADDAHTLLARADEALYAAKRAGRNRVETWAAVAEM